MWLVCEEIGGCDPSLTVGKVNLGRPFALTLRVVVGRYDAGLLAAVALAVLATASVWMASNASIEAARIANDRFKFKVNQAQFAIRRRLTAY